MLPPFPPLAERCALIEVESMDKVTPFLPQRASASKIACQCPRLAQRLNLVRLFAGLRRIRRARGSPRIILLIGRRDAVEHGLVSFFIHLGNDMHLLIDTALHGAGLAIVMEDMAAPFIADGRLFRALDDWSPPFSGYHLLLP
jgi:DNA-binding transcriptional LysR family regulator